MGQGRGDLSALSNALQSYAMANGGDFPDSLEHLVERDANGKSFLQQSVVPRDPWKNEYVYMPPEGNREYELWCYGKDGQPGGEGDDRDLSSQMVRDGQE
ncbi:MAG: type II secretion system protein GspG [Planctomycetota bacterium]